MRAEQDDSMEKIRQMCELNHTSYEVDYSDCQVGLFILFRQVTLGAKGAKMCTQAPAPAYTMCTQAPAPGYINVYPVAAACVAQALAPGYTFWLLLH